MLRSLRLLCGFFLIACAWPANAQAGLPEASWRAVRAMTAEEHVCFAGTSTDASKPVVVMLMSPRMVYSLLEWARMRQTAEALGYRVLSWKDPRVPEAEWRAALGSPAATTTDPEALLAMPAQCDSLWRGMNHSPMSFVLLESHLHPWAVWGVMPEEAWSEALRFRLLALRRALVQSSSR
ncbi:MAG TPA: hypothetical protein DCY64_05115 [Hydrogenophaga sp.]|uniref:hypothetical protein n=1 Tax=Hydrogenophaga sp. TaxID=1904254 RepID=UPI0008C49688|nr:hypothetical protein [Hydrogenophaga sp.]MBU4184550.1 hypothetical protein [Gammaproteobacteria bacterium]MBW8469708.1 hypothetical protein [Thiobacillus sp.]OGA76692.1 MAG: hypothetical protein A2X73_20605 [Burkholderiales bacterium GWE1_65_30]OGA91608.1 MAG: hypothetical protein A2X72_05510 [Burkholderiales bacterium GWF1_66_17]OGB18115.1 MAG: hypothetical protein A3B67_16165 [Burkholderiales bacterium RIFCSPHIGHO2_02_FULL_66_10]OGB28486.1 MAG: hypothetical protein A3I16_06695 [Burkholde